MARSDNFSPETVARRFPLRTHVRFQSKLLLVLILGGCLLGCREVDDSVRVYSVPKEANTRLLAAMIPHGRQVWIFKANGSDERVQGFEKDFFQFLQSIEFADDPDAEPAWELREGWGQLDEEHPKNSGRFPRFATVYKEDKKHVERMEISVSSLPLRSNIPWQQYVKANVDRWRGQLKLPEVEISELDEHTEEIELDNGLMATTVNFVQRDENAEAPANTTAKAGDESSKTGSTPAKQPEAEVPFVFRKPEGWSAGPATAFSALSLQAGDGDKTVVITVTPAGGDLLANVNRWRGQLGLAPIDEQQLTDEASELKAGDVTFSYIKLLGAQRAIWAAVANHAGQVWFVTLKGDKDLARRETANFESFVKSIRFKS